MAFTTFNPPTYAKSFMHIFSLELPCLRTQAAHLYARALSSARPSVLASATVDNVRDVINISSVDIPDAKILKMLKRAEVTLELELGEEIDYQNCTDAVVQI